LGFSFAPALTVGRFWGFFIPQLFSITIDSEIWNKINVAMNILESQVTDLNYLAESPISPIAFSSTMNGQRQSSSAESPADTGNGSGKKRKSDETNANGSTHTRAKRNRYISIAWYV